MAISRRDVLLRSQASATSHCHIGTGPWIGRCRRLSSIRLSLEIPIRYSRPSAMPRRWIRCPTAPWGKRSSIRFSLTHRSRYSGPAGQNNLDQSWVNCEFCGTFGRLEQTPHNLVHVFVGGIMAVDRYDVPEQLLQSGRNRPPAVRARTPLGQANSALDPIFMMHHCNIDRIWWMWNRGGGVNSPDP
jgi:hypothetical protein